MIVPSKLSQNRPAKERFNPQILAGIGSCIPDLIETMNFPVHLKDAQTRKYIIGNSCIPAIHKGIENLESPNDLVGLTADDLLEAQCYIPRDVCERITLRINVNSADRTYTEACKKLDSNAQILKCKVNNNRSGVTVQKQLINFLKEGFIFP